MRSPVLFCSVLIAINGIAPSLHHRGAATLGGDGPLDDMTVRWPAAVLPKPAYQGAFTDPAFGTRIVRVTGDPGTPVSGVGGESWGTVARHNYAKDAAWNADGTWLVLSTNHGGPAPSSGALLFLDGRTYAPAFARHTPFATELRWHPRRPQQMVYVGGNVLGTWDVRTEARKKLDTFGGYAKCHFGPWEGNLSNDGDWVAITAVRRADGKKVAFAYDIKRRTKSTDIAIPDPDWVSISPLHKFVVVHASFGGWDRTKVYTPGGKLVGSWIEDGVPSHYDLAVDLDGEEVAVGSARSGRYDGNLIKRRLRDGVITPLVRSGYATHTSARNLRLPGWVFVTYDGRATDWPPYINEVVAVRLDGSRVVRLCHLRNSAFTYDSQAQACPAPDGLRVIFASDWGAGRLPVQAYVVELPDGLR